MGLFDIIGDLVDVVKDVANDSKEKNQAAYEEIMRRPACYDTAVKACRRINTASFSEKAGYLRALKNVLPELSDRELLNLHQAEKSNIAGESIREELGRRGYMRKNSEGKWEEI